MNGFFNVVSTSPFNYDAAKQYVRDIQWGSFWISMGYIVVIFTIKKVMENRKPFNVSFYQNDKGIDQSQKIGDIICPSFGLS
jgi:hypothetical protein